MNIVAKTKLYKVFEGVLFLCVCIAAQDKPHSLGHPKDVHCTVGDTAVFWVSAKGDAPLSYRWYKGTEIIANEQDSVLRINTVQFSQNGARFKCEISNSNGVALSNEARLTVRKPSSQLIIITGDLYEKDGSVIGASEPVEMDVLVKLYSGFSSDTAVYSESFSSDSGNPVKINRSKFMVRLGEGKTADNLQETVQTHSNLFVEFRVTRQGGVYETLTPRTPLTSSPYSLGGAPKAIKGEGDPNAAKISAPVGTYYINTAAAEQKTFIKTSKSWIELK
ncbi:MAG: immunoglobulin domain-containing protein [Chitinispirillales bacterium]|nr:immunoglobulin domain-containing protein [Chitinispirillales bacterium]